MDTSSINVDRGLEKLRFPEIPLPSKIYITNIGVYFEFSTFIIFISCYKSILFYLYYNIILLYCLCDFNLIAQVNSLLENYKYKTILSTQED